MEALTTASLEIIEREREGKGEKWGEIGRERYIIKNT